MVSCKWLLKLSRNCANWPATNRQLILSQKVYDDFRHSLPRIINNGFTETKYLASFDIKDRIRKLIEYHTLERVQVQGQLTILAYQALEDPANVTDDLVRQINALAWCVEMVQSYYLIVDDIEDEAETRYGKPCWHLLPNVGTLALNDTSMMRSFIYEILKQNLSEDMYKKMCILFNEAYLRSEYGQYLDAITAKTKDIASFNMLLYNNISDNKFTFYSIKFPILVALTMANKVNRNSLQNLDNAMKNIGSWMQMHNDIMDWCDELSTGKSNTDIKKGKCSWLAAAALERCSSEQREIFLSSYGSEKPKDVDQILQLYEELGLRDVFCLEHRARFNSIIKQIDDLPKNSTPPAKFLHDYVEKIYPFIVFYPKALEIDRKHYKSTQFV